MGKKAANFRAWQYQNPHGTVEDAWNAAWEGQNALQYSRTIQRLEADVNAMKGIANTQAEIIGEQNEEIERLKALLAEVRDDIHDEVANRYPSKKVYAPDMRRYEQDMDIVHRIDAALAGKDDEG